MGGWYTYHRSLPTTVTKIHFAQFQCSCTLICYRGVNLSTALLTEAGSTSIILQTLLEDLPPNLLVGSVRVTALSLKIWSDPKDSDRERAIRTMVGGGEDSETET